MGKSIRHIDDAKVPVGEFLNVIRNIENYSITEKVDGSNLWVGFDEHGRFFTSRDAKEGGRYYSVDDWGISFKDTTFKSAHAALSSVASILWHSGMQAETIIEVEVLHSTKPNAVPYHPNQIIFLRNIQGNALTDDFVHTFNEVHADIEIKHFPYTEDGVEIKYRSVMQRWSFSGVVGIEFDFTAIRPILDAEILKMEQFLKAPNSSKFEKDGQLITNGDLLSMRASKNIKDIKLVAQQQDRKYRSKIKDILLSYMVRNISSPFGPSLKDGGWIEGIVLKLGDGKDAELWKIVDDEIYTKVRTFIRGVRTRLTTRHPSYIEPAKNVSILGDLYIELARELGDPLLGTNQAYRILKQYGDNRNTRLKNFPSKVNVMTLTKRWSTLISNAHAEMKERLDSYTRNYKFAKVVDASGREHYIDSATHQRNLETFASLNKQLNSWKRQIEDADNVEDLAIMLLGEKLNK